LATTPKTPRLDATPSSFIVREATWAAVCPTAHEDIRRITQDVVKRIIALLFGNRFLTSHTKLRFKLCYDEGDFAVAGILH
jgi:hypothetical protein